MEISLTNHTGSRNRGCEALVLSKILGFKRVFENANFIVHSNDPSYDAWRFRNLAETYWSYIINTPNHFSSHTLNKAIYSSLSIMEKIAPQVKGINISTINKTKSSDLVIASGGDIFTSDYGNLRKHLAYPLIAGKSKAKTYLCSHSIGPFTKADESYFLKSAESIDLISAREIETFNYLKALDIQTDVHLTADVAFTLPSLTKLEAFQILRKRYNCSVESNLIALSISQGIIKYSGLDFDTYYSTLAGVCDALIDQGKTLLFIPHVMEKNPDNNDVIACDEVISRMRHDSNVVVIDGEPSATVFKGIIGCCEALIGTRTHATIAAMSQGVPTVSIAYSRKAYGIMKDVYGEIDGPRLTIDSSSITVNNLLEALEHAKSIAIDNGHLIEIKTRAENNFILAKSIVGNT